MSDNNLNYERACVRVDEANELYLELSHRLHAGDYRVGRLPTEADVLRMRTYALALELTNSVLAEFFGDD